MTADKPLVSIIIPAFNSAAFIGRALASVRRQDYAGTQIVVVDDGSQDGTADAVLAFGDDIICVRQEHAGPASARNRGIRESRGDFIAFLDSDDEWRPSRLSRCIAPMLQDPSIGMTYCWSEERRLDGSRGRPNESFEKHRAFPRVLWPDPCQCTPATSCRRSVVEQVGAFDESLTAWEDQDLWIRMEEAAGVGVVEETLAIIHVRQGSSSSIPDLETRRACHLKVINKALRRDPGRYGPHKDLIMADYYLIWGINYYSAADHKAARAFCMQSLRLVPTYRGLTFLLRALLPPGLMATARSLKNSQTPE